MRVETRRLLLSSCASLVGVAPSLLWACWRFCGLLGFYTKLTYLLFSNLAHAVILFTLLLWWFGEKRPNLRTNDGVFLSIAVTLVGTMLAAILMTPGIGLIVTGYALLNAFTAVFIYAALAPRLIERTS